MVYNNNNNIIKIMMIIISMRQKLSIFFPEQKQAFHNRLVFLSFIKQ